MNDSFKSEMTSSSGLDGIGSRLRHARLTKRLRLMDIAEQVGCSESMLSKIECGKAIPSLGMLHRVAAALDTSIAELFNAAEGQEFVIYRAGERPSVTIDPRQSGSGIRLERLVPYSAERALEGNIHVVMPGAVFGGAIKHAGEEVGYVVSGSLELTVSERVTHLEPGDSFFFRSDLPHSYRNLGETPAVVVWINTPPTF
jgi:transcriptional regulator with XRE-family HTH domain